MNRRDFTHLLTVDPTPALTRLVRVYSTAGDAYRITLGALATLLLDAVARARTVVVALTSSEGALEINLNAGIDFRLALTESLTSIDLANVPSTGIGQSVRVMLVQGASAYTLPASWGGVTKWRTTAPTIGAIAGDLTVAVLWSTGSEVVGDWAEY